jgi:aspartate carbamoyltransferase regulatory subunit
MEHPINLNYLYCTNMNCRASIYHRMIANIACDTKGQYAMRRCSFCNQLMTSGSDLVLTLMVTAVNNQRTTRLRYLHN